ncbi:MAG: ribosome-associated translation inhibitor RaiA [Chloroflexi bacterium]|mgnify:CR=1 FL=1|nr:ribosome-associated translation inhibitor RaiA [Chloroflexota bacterium]MBT4072729.1 ribosome-associated translation inhibitor RaiA [Chloroflexota bacterium]MBT4513513.1 ribosome-associated translation inhibitor RaiA [Chloroflexota bacterium]MBT5319719.1 ribosome-associated translation inhibitor RaiA [Chloroflexota bacterium]MBT6682698.1 ribosome-associated translation inhibitor RaiA [Chloroflexota bacterium]
MELTVTAKNLPSSPAVTEYAEKRLAKVASRLRDDVPMRLVLRKEGTKIASDRFVAEVTATLKGGTVLRAEERAEDLYVAIDAIADVVARQIRRYRTRQSKRRTSLTDWETTVLQELTPIEPGAGVAEESTEAAVGPDGESVSELQDGHIVRTKTHEMSPMTVEEASSRMELLGHSFFVFQNSADNTISVIYKRHDGDYGLIVPERGS